MQRLLIYLLDMQNPCTSEMVTFHEFLYKTIHVVQTCGKVNGQVTVIRAWVFCMIKSYCTTHRPTRTELFPNTIPFQHFWHCLPMIKSNGSHCCRKQFHTSNLQNWATKLTIKTQTSQHQEQLKKCSHTCNEYNNSKTKEKCNACITQLENTSTQISSTFQTALTNHISNI